MKKLRLLVFLLGIFGFILPCVSLADEEKKEDVDKSVKLERIVVTSTTTPSSERSLRGVRNE